LHIIYYTEKVYTKRRLSRELLIGHKGREQYFAICVWTSLKGDYDNFDILSWTTLQKPLVPGVLPIIPIWAPVRADQRGRDFGTPDLERGIHFWHICNVQRLIKLATAIWNYLERIWIKNNFKEQIKPLCPVLCMVCYCKVVFVGFLCDMNKEIDDHSFIFHFKLKQ